MRKVSKGGMALVLMLMAGRAAGADPTCSPSREDINYMLKSPRLLQPVQSFSTVLAPDAVVATETQALDMVLLQIDRPITTSAPLALHLDAGQTFGRLMIEGAVRPCVYHGTKPFRPPTDEDGRPFPTICLADHDGDGRYESIDLFAYRAAPGHGILQARIDPVRLEPLRDSSAPDLGRYLVHRRLRVVSVAGDRVRFISDFATIVPGSDSGDVHFRPYPSSESEVALREGDVEVSGLKLRLLHVGDSWIATPRGAFSTWVGLYCYDSRIWLLRAPEAAAGKRNSPQSQ
jgi:hypothetical protein